MKLKVNTNRKQIIKIICRLLIIVVISSAMPSKKSEAGVILTGSSLVTFGVGAITNDEIVDDVGMGLFIAGGVLIMASMFSLIVERSLTGAVTTSRIIFKLGVDSSLNQNALEDAFATAYPFIDNRETISSLAYLVKSNAPTTMQSNEKYMVNILPSETRMTLESSDLSELQIQQIMDDLK